MTSRYPDTPEIFVIGDAGSVQSPSVGQVPGIAPAAKQMGQYVGNAIRARIERRRVPSFRYHTKENLATIGRRAAVGKIGRFRLTGRMGWLFWSAAHIYFLIGIASRSPRAGFGTTLHSNVEPGSSQAMTLSGTAARVGER